MANESAVRRLVEMGADVNTQGGKYGSALLAAKAGKINDGITWSAEKYDNITRVLIEAGAEPMIEQP